MSDDWSDQFRRKLAARGRSEPLPQLSAEFVASLREVAWFSRLGEPDETGPGVRIAAAEAEEYLERQVLPVVHDAAAHMQRNLQLQTLHWDRYGEVNQAALEAVRPVMVEVEAARQVRGLHPNAATAARSILVHAAIEDAYRQASKPPTINTALWHLLSRGRVVCGWSTRDESLNTGEPVYC